MMLRKTIPIILFLSFLFAAGYLVSCAHKSSADKLHIFLLIGQSNMAGRAQIEAQDSTALRRVYLLNNKDKWEIAKNPLNKYSTIRKKLSMQRLGPGYSFAKKIAQIFPQWKIGLVVNARGGTGIMQWQKGTPYYNEAVRRTKIAMHSGRLEAILWHQGEHDEGHADSYLPKLQQLINDLRTDFGCDTLPFVAGQVGKFRQSGADINRVIARLPKTVPFTDCVSSEGLTDLGDKTHFNSASQRIFGERYAEKVVGFLK